MYGELLVLSICLCAFPVLQLEQDLSWASLSELTDAVITKPILTCITKKSISIRFQETLHKTHKKYIIGLNQNHGATYEVTHNLLHHNAKASITNILPGVPQ